MLNEPGVFPTRLRLAEILVLVGGAIAPAPAVPATTRTSAWLKSVQEHSSPVSVVGQASGASASEHRRQQSNRRMVWRGGGARALGAPFWVNRVTQGGHPSRNPSSGFRFRIRVSAGARYAVLAGSQSRPITMSITIRMHVQNVCQQFP